MPSSPGPAPNGRGGITWQPMWKGEVQWSDAEPVGPSSEGAAGIAANVLVVHRRSPVSRPHLGGYHHDRDRRRPDGPGIQQRGRSCQADAGGRRCGCPSRDEQRGHGRLPDWGTPRHHPRHSRPSSALNACGIPVRLPLSCSAAPSCSMAASACGREPRPLPTPPPARRRPSL